MFKKIGNYLLTGTFVVLPITVTLFLIAFLIKNIGNPVSQILFIPIIREIDANFPRGTFDTMLIDLLSTVVVVAMIAAIGVVSRFFLGKALISWTESFIRKIPIAGIIYKTVKQLVDTFSKEKRAVFQAVVLVHFPNEKIYSMAFVTNEVRGEIQEKLSDEYINVFMPTTPNPTSGFLMMVKKSDAVYLDMTVGEAMKVIISGGTVASEKNGANLPTENLKPLESAKDSG